MGAAIYSYIFHDIFALHAQQIMRNIDQVIFVQFTPSCSARRRRRLGVPDVKEALS